MAVRDAPWDAESLAVITDTKRTHGNDVRSIPWAHSVTSRAPPHGHAVCQFFKIMRESVILTTKSSERSPKRLWIELAEHLHDRMGSPD
jgi:hypothetical protein